jgi:hypothetical protein
MHIHHNPAVAQNTELHSASGAEKAAATQRAANVRRKLLKESARIGDGDALDRGAVFMVDRWEEGGDRKPPQPRQQSAGTEEAENAPVSFWA